jgi:hypothetical protein
MNNRNFIILHSIFNAVTLVCYGSLFSEEGPKLELEGGAVHFICVHEHNSQISDPMALKFNKLVSDYFVANFGPGGKKYLEFVKYGEPKKTRRDCVPTPSDSGLARAYKAEMNRIVSYFWRYPTRFRYRIHRLVGIMDSNAIADTTQTKSYPFGTDYLRSLPDYRARTDFVKKLRHFEELTQSTTPPVKKQLAATIFGLSFSNTSTKKKSM